MRFVYIAILPIVLLLVSGCSQLKPKEVKQWERDRLSKDIMAWNPDAMDKRLQDHIAYSKEGSTGGGQAAGGGCGCN